MRVFVGLGNPGDQYINTRHNVGFMVVEKLAQSSWVENKNKQLAYSWLGDEVELVKPLTFMNNSGDAAAQVIKKHRIKPEDLCVIHDDLDIRLGDYKIQFGKGPKIHNGVNSVIEKLHTDQFWRVRIGVESRLTSEKVPGKVYLLQNFSDEQRSLLNDVLERVVNELEGTVLKGLM